MRAAKIHNERMKAIAGIVNTLSTAVVILGILRPQIEASSAGAVVNLRPDVNILWVVIGVTGYALGMAILGLMREES